MRAIVTASLPTPDRTVCLADDDTEPLVSGQGFSVAEVLSWICQAGRKQLITWSLDSQVNHWLSGAPLDARLRLFSGYADVLFGEYRLTYIHGKMLDVRRLREKWTICDLSGFWDGQTLAEVMCSIPLETLDPRSLFDAGLRKEWRDHRLAGVVYGCRERARDIARLEQWLTPQLEKNDLTPSRMYGVGSIASKLIKDTRDDHWIARYRPDRQPTVGDQELLPVFLQAYYGGRNESTVVGSWAGAVYDYDLSSAYPWAMSWLGPVGFLWQERQQFDPDISARMSTWYVIWDVRPSWLGPLPFRSRERGGITYPQTGQGWYWWPEVRAAIRAYGEASIRVVKGYVSPGSDDQPLLPMIAQRYDQRRRLEAEGSPIASILKRSIAAVYGKFAQGEAKDGKPGRWYNPALAGWVTSMVRARLIEAWGGSEGMVCTISTDGMLTTMPLPNVTTRTQLGGWKVAAWDYSEVILPGVYRLSAYGDETELTAQKTATAGLSTVDFDWLRRETSHGATARVTQEWFVPNLLADLFPDAWGAHRCRWKYGYVPVSSWRMAHKRQSGDGLLALDTESDVLAFSPYETRGTDDSAPSPLPPMWQEVKPSLTDLALQRIIPS